MIIKKILILTQPWNYALMTFLFRFNHEELKKDTQ